MYRYELFGFVIALFVTHSYASPFSTDMREKRPFCNGYFGCRNGKRSMGSTIDLESNPSFPLEPSVTTISKRPFCNGFRGCANGKRSLDEDIKDIETAPPRMELALKADKRPFCNGFRGCANGKRSNVLDRDELWFLQKLLENISRQDMRERGPYSGDGTLRRKRRSIHNMDRSSTR